MVGFSTGWVGGSANFAETRSGFGPGKFEGDAGDGAVAPAWAASEEGVGVDRVDLGMLLGIP